MPKTHKIYQADYPFSCALCGKEHPKGTRALFENEKLISADCKWPQKIKPNAPPKTITQGAQSDKKTDGSLLTKEQWVQANIDWAVQEVKRRLAEHPELIECSQGLMTEVMHERYGLYTTAKIQASRLG